MRRKNYRIRSPSPYFAVQGQSRAETTATRYVSRYKVDNRLLFDPNDRAAQQTLAEYVKFAISINLGATRFGLEASDSLRRKYSNERLIIDNNMDRKRDLYDPIPWR